MFRDFPMRFQISLRPYVTTPCILSKDTVADLALLVKLQPHYIPYGLFMFSSELECCTRNSSKIDTQSMRIYVPTSQSLYICTQKLASKTLDYLNLTFNSS